MKRDFTDAKFELVSGPLPVPYAPTPKPPTEPLNLLGWIYVWVIFGTAGFTLIMGLLGAALDTRPKPEPAAAVIPQGAIPIQPVPHV